MFELMGKDINNTFYLIDHDISFDDSRFGSREVDVELEIITLDKDILSSDTFNDV